MSVAAIRLRSVVLIAMAATGVAGCFFDRGGQDLFLAVSSGDLVEIKSILEENPAIKDAYLNDGWTALTVAARDGNVSAVNLLIEEGAGVNRLEGGGNSPLFWAVYYNHEDVVSTLLSRGAAIHNKCATCRDPMEVARAKNYERIFNLLVQRSKNS